MQLPIFLSRTEAPESAMAAPYSKLACAFHSILLATGLIAVAEPARAGMGPVCLRPPLLAPTREPPLADALAFPPTNPIPASAEPADPPAPVVVLRIRVSADAVAGQELEYRICVENCSPA